MAKTPDKSDDQAKAADSLPRMPTAPVPCPANTPVPGGGRWAWSEARHGWISADLDAGAQAAADQTPSSTS